jgi:hypothetical protein
VRGGALLIRPTGVQGLEQVKELDPALPAPDPATQHAAVQAEGGEHVCHTVVY